MFNRSFSLSFLFAVSILLLPLPVEAGIPFWGPIIPDEATTGVRGSDLCPLGWGAVIVVINNIISFALTVAIVFVLPLAIAYGGFRYIINPISAEGRSEANKIVTNVVVGIVLALAAWMIIDLVMITLYNPPGGIGGTWRSLISGNMQDFCLDVKGVILER